MRSRCYTLLSMLALGCGFESQAPEGGPVAAPSEQIAQIRAILTEDEENCFADRLAFCITDPAFVDPIIQAVIETSFHGTVKDVDAVARRSRGRYRAAQLDDPEARARVEQKIAQAFADPQLRRKGEVLHVDLGLAPGPLERALRAGWSISSSSVVREGQLDGQVAAKALAKGMAVEPKASKVVVDVLLPGLAGTSTREEISYDGRLDRVVVHLEARHQVLWVTEKLGGDLGPYVRGERSLRIEDLIECSTRPTALETDDRCPVGGDPSGG